MHSVTPAAAVLTAAAMQVVTLMNAATGFCLSFVQGLALGARLLLDKSISPIKGVLALR